MTIKETLAPMLAKYNKQASQYDVKKMGIGDLVDIFGAAKADEADASKVSKAIKSELLRRKKAAAKERGCVVMEGTLFRVSITYSMSNYLNTDKVRELLSARQLMQCIKLVPKYTVRSNARTGEKGK